DGARPLAGAGQPNLVGRLLAGEHPGDHRIFALVDRAGARLAAHRAVDRLDRELAGEAGDIGLPRADLALARLARREGEMHRLIDRLEDDRGGKVEQPSDPY